MAFPVPSSPFTIAPLPGKGVSVIATTPIPANTLLFTEPPLLLLTNESHASPRETRVLNTFLHRPWAQKQTLLSLCSNLTPGVEHSDETVVLGVWKANNFCLDDAGTVNGVFELASRLNHACVGGENCRWEWDAARRVLAFWTVTDVLAGEELTHCYRPDWRMGTKNRTAALFEEYGFWCSCKTCVGPEEDD